MLLSRDRPEILTPPGHPPACCTQRTITCPPQVAAKTRQKHDYPSAAWRRSYRRRTSAERANATIKDPAATLARGRAAGPTPITLWIACLLAIRNQRIAAAFQARQDDNARRAAAGLPPRTRKRRVSPSPPLPPGRHNQHQQAPARHGNPADQHKHPPPGPALPAIMHQRQTPDPPPSP